MVTDEDIEEKTGRTDSKRLGNTGLGRWPVGRVEQVGLELRSPPTFPPVSFYATFCDAALDHVSIVSLSQ